MLSKDQATQVAETLQKPSYDELDAKKKKLAGVLRRRRSPAFPAGAAALATFLCLSNGVSPMAALMIGTTVGWAAGSLMQREI